MYICFTHNVDLNLHSKKRINKSGSYLQSKWTIEWVGAEVFAQFPTYTLYFHLMLKIYKITTHTK